MIYFAILLFVMVSSSGAKATTRRDSSIYADCPNDYYVLEKALFDMKGNKMNLTKTFYLPQKHPLGFVHIYYFFKDIESGEYDDCNVEFLWASGGFLLIQPPSVVRFSSLFFSDAVDDLEEVTITLPLECLPLVFQNESCSCSYGSNDNLLVLLTKQVCSLESTKLQCKRSI